MRKKNVAKAKRFSSPYRMECLEDRCVPAIVNLSVYDQLLIELVNRARANPALEAAMYGVGLNDGVVNGPITATPKQPLAPHQALVNSAQSHALDMLANDYFGHVNLIGQQPYQRAQAAGYPTTFVGENIAWTGTTGAIDPIAAIYNRHAGLVQSPGHRSNMMAEYWNEIGTSIEAGQFTVSGTTYNAVMAVENFGSRNGRTYLTGVAYTDFVVHDNFYTIGEQLAGITIIATSSTGSVYTTQTGTSGGYALEVPDGIYTVVATGPVLNSIRFSNVVVAGQNVKVDFTPGGGDPVPPPTANGIDNVVVAEDAANTSIDLYAAFDDPEDSDSELTFQLIGNTNPSLFSSITIAGDPKQLVLDYAPNAHGVTLLTIRAINTMGAFADTTFSVTVTSVNDVPVLETNELLGVFLGGPTVVGPSHLNVTDVESSPSQLVYVLDSVPARGQLRLNGIALTTGAQFTQADVNAGRLTYTPSGSTGDDQFQFHVSDGSGGTIATTAFNLRVRDVLNLQAIGNQTVSYSVDTFQIPLVVTGLDGAAQFSATAADFLARLRNEHGFNTPDQAFNMNGLGDKWLIGANNVPYFLLPDGNLYRYLGFGSIFNNVVVAHVGADVYNNPSLLYNAGANGPPATISFNGNTMTVDPVNGFQGTFIIDVTVTDDSASDRETFIVTITNSAPTISPIANQQVSHNQDTVMIPVSITDADGDSLTVTAQATTALGALRQQFGFNTPEQAFNANGIGEKWLVSATGLAYFLLPDGNLYRYLGTGSIYNSVPVAAVGATVYNNPSLLYNAPTSESLATVTYAGGNLIVDPADNYIGTFTVNVAVSDGVNSATTSFQVTVVNSAPVIAPIANQQISHNQDSITVPVSITDADGDSLTITAQATTPLGALRQQFGFNTPEQGFNANGIGEKWLVSATGVPFFLLSNGFLYRYLGTGNIYNSVPVAAVGAEVYNNPSLLYNAPTSESMATVTYAGGNLTIDPVDSFIGTFIVNVAVSDGVYSATTTFQVTVVNNAPVIAPVADQQMSHNQDSITVPVSITDADGDSLTVTAQATTALGSLRQQFGLNTPVQAFNSNGIGEKWLVSDVGVPYFLLSNGFLYRYLGAGDIYNSVPVAAVGAEVYNNPSLLYSAPNATSLATVTYAGGNLTIDPVDGFSGTFVVIVTADDGASTATSSFLVNVVNNAPMIAPIAGQQMNFNQGSITIPVSITDPDGDLLTVTAQATTALGLLRQQLGLNTPAQAFNANGIGEKWLVSDTGVPYFLLSNGFLYRYLGTGNIYNSVPVAAVGAKVYNEPSLLYNAPASVANVMYTPGQLVIEPVSGFVGTIYVSLTASDGSKEVAASFEVTVFSAAGAGAASQIASDAHDPHASGGSGGAQKPVALDDIYEALDDQTDLAAWMFDDLNWMS